MSIFSGLSAFPVTPADEQGVVDCDFLGRLVERLAVKDVSSVGVLGSTGGYVYLSMQERKRAVECAVEAAGNKPVVVGIGALRASEVYELAGHAERAGASGVLLAPVSYLPLTETDVTCLIEGAFESTALPICFYNNPVTTHYNLSEDLLIKLAERNLVTAVKNPPPVDHDFKGQMERLVARVPAGFSLGYSGDTRIAAALSAGSDAWYSVVGGTLPDLAISLWKARGNPDELQKLDSTLKPLWSAFDIYVSIRVVYEVVNMLGLGAVKLPQPLQPLDATACAQIESALVSLDVIR